MNAPAMGSRMSGFTWSYSKLKNFETCPKRHLHYDVLRDVREPESAQMGEGHALHKAFELRVKNAKPLPLGMMQHEGLLARIIAAPGETYAEQKLALTQDFKPSGYFSKTVWFRTVVDLCKVNGAKATVFDYKTGKPNADMTQLQLLAATIFHYIPTLERIKSALIFVNHDHVEPAEFVRGDLTEIWSEIMPRVRAVEKAQRDEEFPPKPSGLCVKYCAVTSCPYHGRGTR
jgi:hypothetical protein